MSRLLYTQPQPQPLSLSLSGQLVAPTRQAARDFAAPHCQLEGLARRCLGQADWQVAPTLSARRQLRASVQAVLEPRDPLGTSRAVKPALDALLRANLDLERLQAEAAPRVADLARLAQHYRQALAERRLVDPADLLWKATELGQPSDRRAYLFYGYFQPRRDQLAWIDAIAGPGSQWWLPWGANPRFSSNQRAIADLQQRGWQTVEGETGGDRLGDRLQARWLAAAGEPVAGARVAAYPNQEAEVRSVLAQVKARLADGVPARDLVLVARDERSYGPLLAAIAWEYGVPLRLLYKIPLRETRLGAWLALVAAAIQNDFPYELTAQMLAHPLAQQLSPEAWEQARQRRPRGLAAWQACGCDLSAYVWPDETAPRAVWMQHWRDFCQANQVRHRASHWPAEILAYNGLQAALDDLTAVSPEPLSGSDFWQELLDWLDLLATPAQPGRGGVELHSPLTLFGARYAEVFVLGAAEGTLPATLENDSWLDFHARRHLAAAGFDLEAAPEMANREALSFYFLLGLPEMGLHLSYPERRDRDPQLPSPHLATLGLEPVAPTAVPLASPEEERRAKLLTAADLDEVGQQARRAWEIERRRERAEPPDEYDGVIGVPLDPAVQTLSATQLQELGQCPFKWFAKRLLRLQEPPEAAADLEISERGRLYHRCLELVLQDGQTRLEVAQVSLAALSEAFRAAEQELALPERPAWTVQREEHLATLHLNLQPDNSHFLAPGAAIADRERTFTLDNWHGLRLTGKIDRVDREPEGLRVLDYKTGSSVAKVQDASGAATLEVQLAIYSAAIAQAFGEPPHRAQYYSLTKREIINAAPSEAADLEAFAARVSAHLAAGSYPVAPDREQTACTYCPYDLVCRRGPRLQRRGSID